MDDVAVLSTIGEGDLGVDGGVADVVSEEVPVMAGGEGEVGDFRVVVGAYTMVFEAEHDGVGDAVD